VSVSVKYDTAEKVRVERDIQCSEDDYEPIGYCKACSVLVERGLNHSPVDNFCDRCYAEVIRRG
jgi:hypothetical protein